MKNSEEITLFGHTIPKKIYDDYKNLEKFKDEINKLLDNSDKLNEAEKHAIKSIFSNISDTFNCMEFRNHPKPPCMNR